MTQHGTEGQINEQQNIEGVEASSCGLIGEALLGFVLSKQGKNTFQCT